MSSIKLSNQPQLKKVIGLINKGYKVMVIMRGAPGCGKTYTATEIVNATTGDEYRNHIFSCDGFFQDEYNYKFHSERIGEAQEWNQSRVRQFAHEGWSPIIVDNTNINPCEMNKYLEIAGRYNYLVEFIEPNTSWSRSADQLAMKNTHNVPKEAIETMLANYELITVPHAMKKIGINYNTSPRNRLNPPLPLQSNTSRQTPAPKTQQPTNRLLPTKQHPTLTETVCNVNTKWHKSEALKDDSKKYRDLASQQLKLANEHTGMRATIYMRQADAYNSKAANCLIEAHALNQNDPDTLDLHYLSPDEALQSLENFLNQHVAKLKAEWLEKKHVFVITGRGNNNKRGVEEERISVVRKKCRLSQNRNKVNVTRRYDLRQSALGAGALVFVSTKCYLNKMVLSKQLFCVIYKF